MNSVTRRMGRSSRVHRSLNGYISLMQRVHPSVALRFIFQNLNMRGFAMRTMNCRLSVLNSRILTKQVRMLRKTSIALALLIAIPISAHAAVWNEVGDAGQLLGTSQIVTGAGPLTNIIGTITPVNDVDLYGFSITNAGLFSASLNINGGSTNFDAQLWLFDANGIGVAAIDDSVNMGGDGGTLTSTFVTGTGLHYIGVSSWNNEATSAGGLIFPDHDGLVLLSNIEVTNTGPGGASPLSGWNNSGAGGGIYNIALNASSPIPEPSTIIIWSLLMGLTWAGGAWRHFYRKRKA